jgi:ribonucleoside-diphosphate reductase beta chain
MKTILTRPDQTSEYALFPLKYEWAWDSYKLMLANFWTPEEIGTGHDLQDWRTEKLTEAEKHLFLTVFAQVTTFDLLRTADIVKEFLPLTHAPEIVHVLTAQAFQECVHTHSYQYVIESLGLPQDDIYTRYKNVPQLYDRVKLTERLGSFHSETSVHDIFRGLIHTYVVFEGCWFMLNLLGPVQALARRGMMKGTAEQFQYIARDEQSHVALGLHLIRDFVREHPQVMAKETINEVLEDTRIALEMEGAFIHYALPTPIMGYNAEDHIKTAAHYVERWLGRLGIDANFGGEHRFPWVDEMIATKKEKNFFETRVTEYQVGGSLRFDDNDPSSQFESVI